LSAYYVGIVVGALLAGVVVFVGELGLPRWLPYAINLPLVMLGAWLVRSLL
jgi:hypothetical protein